MQGEVEARPDGCLNENQMCVFLPCVVSLVRQLLLSQSSAPASVRSSSLARSNYVKRLQRERSQVRQASSNVVIDEKWARGRSDRPSELISSRWHSAEMTLSLNLMHSKK